MELQVTLLLVGVLALWDIGRRVTNTRGQYASRDHVKNLQLSLDNQIAVMASTQVDISNLKAVTAAQGQTLARHTALLTKEALEKTQPLTPD